MKRSSRLLRRSLIGRSAVLLASVLGLTALTPVQAQPAFIVVASTTSTEQSGLFKHLLPSFTRQTGIEVRVVAVGTGQALDIGRRGDADEGGAGARAASCACTTPAGVQLQRA